MVGNVHCINGFKNYLQTFKVLSQMYLSWTLIVFLLATQDFIAFGFANTNWPYFFFVLRIPQGVAVSYSWDFLICITFCATMVIVLNPPACLAWLGCFVYKVSRSAVFTSNYGHWFSFVLLFKQSWVWFFDSFRKLVNCLLLLNKRIFIWKFKAKLREAEGNLGQHSHFLTEILNDFCVKDVSFVLNCSSICVHCPWVISLRLLILFS